MLRYSKAWVITTKNASTLSHISGRDEKTISANIGWVLIEEWSPLHKFSIIPRSYFNDAYSGIVELSTLKVDE